jgi:hypothetical protein
MLEHLISLRLMHDFRLEHLVILCSFFEFHKSLLKRKVINTFISLISIEYK